jgi:protein-disulfide isomerase
MNFNRLAPYTGALILALATVAAVACGDDDGDTEAEETAECEPGDEDDDESACGPGAREDDDAGETATVVEVSGSEEDTFADVSQDGNTLGSADAPVEVVLHENFLCPHCADFSLNVLPGLVEDYVATDEVRFVFEHTPLGGEPAVLAHIAAACAGEQDRLWNYAELLFANQSSLESSDEEGVLRSLATDAGLEEEAFEVCLEDEGVRSVVQTDLSEFEEAVPEDQRALPVVQVNGELLPAPTDADVREAIEAALSQ